MRNVATDRGDGGRPNVLVVLTDQQTAQALSCAGNPHVNTPHLDALAAEGVRFTNAYCAQPLCTPSRASMWTGRTPTELGVRGNGVGLSPEDLQHQLGAVMSAAGYDCGYAGKWHLPELDVPEYASFRQVHDEIETGLVDSCRAFLDEERAGEFLLVASLTEPHGSCQWARGQTPPSGPVAEVDWQQWPPLPPNYARTAYEPELPQIGQRLTPHTHPTLGWEEQQWRRYIHAFYRLCERADAQVGALMQALVDSGHRDDTLVIFSSDHGDQLAAHQRSQKWVLYEESMRVPLIISEPGGPRGQQRDDLVHVGLDLLPTIAAAAAAPVGRPLTGHSLRDHDRADPWREFLHTETMWEVPGVQHLTGRSVRGTRFKYTCYAWGQHREQLIDLDSDPGEMSNLAVVGEYQVILNQMRELVREESHRVGDAKFASFVPVAGTDPV